MVTPERRADDVGDTALRPQLLAEFVGQAQARANLSVFITAAQTRGETPWYTMLWEILPNARGPLIVDACLRMGYTTIAIGVLGFLGLGLPPPDPDWGGMVNQGVRWLAVSSWMTAMPAVALASLVIGINLVADALQSGGRR